MIKNEIKEKFSILRENHNPVSVLEYFDFLKSKDVNELLDHAALIYIEPTRGVNFLKESVENTFPRLEVDKLQAVSNSMHQYYTKAQSNKYNNQEHLDSIYECIKSFEEKISDFNQNEIKYLKEDTLFQLDKERIQIVPDGEDPIVEHIGDMHPVIGDEPSEYEVLQVQNDFSKSFVKTFMTDINEISLSSFNEMMKAAHKYGKLYESYEDEVTTEALDKTVAHVSSNIQVGARMAFSRDKKATRANYIKKLETKLKVLQDKKKEFSKKDSKEKRKILLIHGPGYELSLDRQIRAIQMAISHQKQKVTEGLELEESLLEAGIVHKTAKKVALAGDSAARKTATGIKKMQHQSRQVKTIATKKVPGHFDRLIDNTLGSIKKMDNNERRKRIVEGNMRTKVFKIIRNGILVGLSWAVSPALAAIGIIAYLCNDHKVDRRVRIELADELEHELRMTKEKIKDAEAKGDNKKKYQLMRIENALEKDLERIRYGFKTNKTSSFKGVK